MTSALTLRDRTPTPLAATVLCVRSSRRNCHSSSFRPWYCDGSNEKHNGCGGKQIVSRRDEFSVQGYAAAIPPRCVSGQVPLRLRFSFLRGWAFDGTGRTHCRPHFSLTSGRLCCAPGPLGLCPVALQSPGPELRTSGQKSEQACSHLGLPGAFRHPERDHP
jgi:hypothetical protein